MKNKIALLTPILILQGCFAPNLSSEETAETDLSSSSGPESTSAASTLDVGTSSETTTGEETTTADEPGSTTTGDASTTGGDVPSAICGDGVAEGDEDCDEGGLNGVAGKTDCLSDCTLTVCGDGFPGLPTTEECDQGEENADSAACTASCSVGICGDELVGPGESCDDGPTGSDLCTPSCALASCGDGLIQRGEECDDDNNINTDACVNCVGATCGDGFVEAGIEQCDNGAGNAIDPVACAYGVTEEDCTYCAAGSCSIELGLTSYCGDGNIQAGSGETCDDGDSNTNITPTCAYGVVEEDCTYCDATSCTVGQGNTTYCGDGALQASEGETCDNGAANGPNGSCLSNCTINVCGDGYVGPDEVCDNGEGNTLAAGACAPDCSTIIEAREITISGLIGNGDGNFGANPVAAADAACPAGYRALLTDPGTRQVTNTANEADFIIDWPLAPYTQYVSSLGDQIWVTDDVPLLGVRNGEAQPVENVLSQGGGLFGYFLVTGMEQDWTPLSSGATCLNYTSNSSSLGMQMGAAALPAQFIRAEGAVYDCDQPLMRVYCIEQ